MVNISLKTPDEITLMTTGGKKLKTVLAQAVAMVRSGTTLKQIEEFVWRQIEKAGAKPAFALVPGYHWATCINVNEGIVHGIPGEYHLKKGDLVTIDAGLVYKGFNVDTSTSFQVNDGQYCNLLQENGEVVLAKDVQAFLECGQKALISAMSHAVPGNRIGHISSAIQKQIEVVGGYHCARNLIGHGVGRELHEPPAIPCFIEGLVEATPLIKTGMTLAIEVIYTYGEHDLVTDKDGWTIRTRDGKIAAVFEKTIAVSDDGYLVLT